MPKPKRIGHATFQTPDLDRQIDYHTQINGLVLVARERERAFLASRMGFLTVQLERGDVANCVRLSFEVAPDSDFGQIARELSEFGIKSEVRSNPNPAMPRLLAFDDPKGTTIELYAEWKCVSHNQTVAGVGPFKLGHVAFSYPDPAKLAEFYERVLGFRVSDWIEDYFVFLRCGPDHHTVNFLRNNATKMQHIAFELKDAAHLNLSCDLLGQKRIPIIWGPVRHGPGHNIAAYHRDFDDQIVEHFIDLDQMKDEELGYFEPRPWHMDRPQRPKVWAAGQRDIWGPPPTPEFMRGRG